MHDKNMRLEDRAKELGIKKDENPIVEQFCHAIRQELYEHMADFVEHHKKDDPQSKSKAIRDVENIKDMLKVYDRTMQLKHGTLGRMPEHLQMEGMLKKEKDGIYKLMAEFGIDDQDDDNKEKFLKHLKENPEMQRKVMEKMNERPSGVRPMNTLNAYRQMIPMGAGIYPNYPHYPHTPPYYDEYGNMQDEPFDTMEMRQDGGGRGGQGRQGGGSRGERGGQGRQGGARNAMRSPDEMEDDDELNPTSQTGQTGGKSGSRNITNMPNR